MKELFKKQTAWGPADPSSVNKGLNHENQIIPLIIPNRKGRNYLAVNYFVVNKVSASLKGIRSKHVDYCYCLNCLHSFTIKDIFESKDLK